MRTLTCWLAVAVVLLSAGCSLDVGAIGGVGGKCHHTGTGEVLAEVMDAAGEPWKVQKLEVTAFDVTLTYCGVSLEAFLGDEPVGGVFGPAIRKQVLYPPSVGGRGAESIDVEGPRRGMYILDSGLYEWR